MITAPGHQWIHQNIPNYSMLNKMKLKGDSIIKSIYSEAFFNNYVKWNFDSYYFDKTYGDEPSFTIDWMFDNARHAIKLPNSIYDTTFATKQKSTKKLYK